MDPQGTMEDSIALPENDSVFAGVGEHLSQELHRSDVLIEDSFSSFAGAVASSATQSTPRTAKRPRVAEKVMPPPKIPCQTCGKRYANEKTFSVHMRWHSMKLAANRAPKHLDIQAKMEMFQSVVVDMLKEKKLGQLGVDLQVYLQFLSEVENDSLQDIYNFLSDTFYNVLRNEKSLFPSSIRTIQHNSYNNGHLSECK